MDIFNFNELQNTIQRIKTELGRLEKLLENEKVEFKTKEQRELKLISK